jgi:YD repeat-containing protein
MGAADFTSLDDEDRLAAFATTSPEFQRALLVHVAEGMFAAPEYGGNRDTLGWREYEYDGDSQPLGHTLFDRTTQTLRDRPDEPSEAADPNRPPRPFPADVEGFLTAITAAQGGRRFF